MDLLKGVVGGRGLSGRGGSAVDGLGCSSGGMGSAGVPGGVESAGVARSSAVLAGVLSDGGEGSGVGDVLVGEGRSGRLGWSVELLADEPVLFSAKTFCS